MNRGPAGRDPGDERPVGDETPPGGGSWNRWYAIVIGWLILQILVYWFFTKAWS